jgi:hypothetical protein
MKLFSMAFIALPFLFGALTWLLRESDRAFVFFLFWLAASIACLVRGFVIRRQHLPLTWVCIGVGVLQFALMFVLPLFISRKTF